MSIAVRAYRHADDFEMVSRFLVELFEPGDGLANWLLPRWEYMHYHPNIDDIDLSTIGIAEDDTGRPIGVVHPEHSPAFAHYQVLPGTASVRPALLHWALEHLGGWSRSLGREILGCWVDDADSEMQTILMDQEFTRSTEFVEPHSRLRLSSAPPSAPIPQGYRLAGLDECNDLAQVNRVLWRGFDHPGPPPEALIPTRAHAQRAPGFRPHLNIIALAPAGHYVSYAGVWFVPENRVAYVEPVATDPDHRRMGLGTAVVLEALRRATELGAEVAWVGSDLRFYLTMGFEVVTRSTLWFTDRPIR